MSSRQRSESGSGRPVKRGANPPRRNASQGELRQAVGGREHEFIGVALLAVGVLLGLAMYLDLAGPLGRGIEEFVGWFLGMGRYLLPVVLVASGVALVKKGQSSSPVRLVIGWGLMGLAVLGFLHIIRTPESLNPLADSTAGNDLTDGGGWIGAVVSAPLRALVASVGAVVLLIAAFVGGLLLITQTSLRTMAEQTGRSAATVAKPIGRAARKALSDLSTLNSDRSDDRRSGRPYDEADLTDQRHAGAPDVHGEPLAPAIYDGAADDADMFTAPTPKRRRKRSNTQQAALAIDGDQVGDWVLPPLSYLKQAGQQAST